MKRTEDDIVLKLLHTADWHLGRRFPRFGIEAGKTLSRARRDVLERIFLEAERSQVDAVLCAGDLFDTPQPDEDFKSALLQVLTRLKWKNRPVFLLPGNHDPLVAESVWREPSFRKALPDFVHVVDQELLEVALPNDCVLFAVPCLSRAGQKDPTTLIPLRADGDTRVRVGLVHGSTFDAGDWKTNFPISKDAALERGLDYLAIGDTHGFRFVPPDRKVPPTIYPGTPEQTAFDEQDAGNVALVFINRSRQAMVQKRAVGQWKWEELTVKSMEELRLLAMRTDLAARVLRLTLELRVTAPEYQEVETILGKLQGSASTHARVGVLELDRERLRLDLTNLDALSAGLPPVLQAAAKRLKVQSEDPAQRAAAERALFHLFSLAKAS
ncbi:MAG: DNA repair exonuclease [Archangium sp.]|nr:DNA repair exonuclease [Archangium sp.]